jgi:hypothetical protein
VAPRGTEYVYTIGHSGDYFQYVSLLKEGREGRLLFHNQYDVVERPNILLQPFYLLAGFLSRPFPLTPIQLFQLLHVAAIGIFFITVSWFVRKIIEEQIVRIAAFVAAVWVSPFWFITRTTSGLHFDYANVYTDYFTLFMTLMRVSTHHFLAHTFLLISIYFAGRTMPIIKKSILQSALIVAIAFLHPYIALIYIVIVASYGVLRLLIEKKNGFKNLLWIGPMIGLGVCTVGFQTYEVVHLLGLSENNASYLSGAVRMVSFSNYWNVLGPLFPLALCVVLFRSLRKKPIIQLLLLWTVLPIVLFFLPDFKIPIVIPRLLQIYQHIPIGILAAISIRSMVLKLHVPGIGYGLLILVILLYGLVPFGVHYIGMIRDTKGEPWLTVYIPDYTLHALDFLKKQTPPHSLVVGGMYISSIIPAYTDNHVLIGHDGNSPHISQKVADADTFFYTDQTADQKLEFLRKYHVSYIIFGVDGGRFDILQQELPAHLTPVFQEGLITVAKVIE